MYPTLYSALECNAALWRATLEENGHYCFAVTL
jgi:hypothetical protein